MRLRKVFLPAVLLLLSALPGAAAPKPPRTLADVQASGKLVMLCYPHQESAFIHVDVEKGLGHYGGIDYDLLDGFAKSLGVVLEVRPVKPSFSELVPDLLAGKGDVIASSFSITPERNKKVAFSTPYFTVKRVVVARKGSGLLSPADLAGRTGSAVKNSSLHERMKTLPGVQLHFEEFPRWNLDAVDTGKAAFTLVDDSGLRRLLPLYPALEIAFALPEEDFYSFALMPGSQLLGALNVYINRLEESGELAAIVKRHLDPPATR